MQLTVYRDGAFWVGVAEEVTDGRYKACRHVFGTEPHDAEVLEFINFALPLLFRRTASSLEAPALQHSESQSKAPRPLNVRHPA